jgi:DtxR family Mn-dependent transcriptional regulator
MKGSRKRLSTSLEDYLEAIYVLEQKNSVVRVKDISKMLKVSMPSVHQALHILMESDLIEHEKYGYVELTVKGRSTGKEIYNRHMMLLRFLNEILNIPLKTAKDDACRIEHSISQETLNKLVSFIDFVDTCPEPGGPDWLKSFRHFSKTGKRPKRCKKRRKK